MCGITGIFHARSHDVLSKSDLLAAVEALRLRGPDDRGTWIDADCVIGLGHTRLSIIDLSAAGHQPMLSDDGNLVMVFNGEIYNFAEIRKELVSLGYQFRGTGDSEVILAGFKHWGVRHTVSLMIGMFAIALWDQRARSLTLVRDRLGVKPLYYGWDGRCFWFGSELKALRAYGSWTPAIDHEALFDLFQYGYIADPRSIYQGVKKLEPGTLLEISLGGEPKTERYWSVLDAVGRVRTLAEDEAIEQLEALLVDAFRLRMVADVPVGVFLSGGIDSSLLSALLQKHTDRTIKTFTIAFDSAEHDEAPYAAAVASHLRTEHRTLRVTSAEAMSILPRWGDLYDEPFGDDSGIPTFLVSRMASEHVKVVLSADGGDELFSGYESYTSVLAQMQERAVQSHLSPRALAKLALSRVPWETLDDDAVMRVSPGGYADRVRQGSVARLRDIRGRRSLRTLGQYFDYGVSIWKRSELDRLLGRTLSQPGRADCDTYPGVAGERMCLWDLHNYLPGNVLTKVDRATMAASVEGREPLIDHRVVEFAFSLPFALRRGALGSKHALRRILYSHIPRGLVERPKQGFAPPMEAWLSGPMRSMLSQYLAPSRLSAQGLLDPIAVQAMLRRFDAGDRSVTQRLWLLLALQLWHARWME